MRYSPSQQRASHPTPSPASPCPPTPTRRWPYWQPDTGTAASGAGDTARVIGQWTGTTSIASAPSCPPDDPAGVGA
ncbi:hypothetical protein A11M_0115320 [Xanthomonas vasicola pv. vasculorum NCPPB 895]|nr:hypothetical protein A11M_0115320 [Xanthomonas vasicola pv. vasculorum NCPPB 895]